MAFSVTNGQPAGRRRFHGTSSLSEINVVPLVDVVLVLLIIFMLTAHVMEFGLEVDVPKVKQVKDSAEEFPVVTLTKEGVLYLHDQQVNINDLPAAIRKRHGAVSSVYLRADKGTVWDPIAQVMSELGQAGFKVNAVTQPLDEAGRRRR